jgi:hypothetical protein
MCYGTTYSDLCYGFNAFWRRHVPVFGLDPRAPRPAAGHGRRYGDGFEVETLINIRAAKAGLAVAEVPSFEHPRIHGSSNLSAVRDGWRILKVIVRERLGSGARGHGPAVATAGTHAGALATLTALPGGAPTVMHGVVARGEGA